MTIDFTSEEYQIAQEDLPIFYVLFRCRDLERLPRISHGSPMSVFFPKSEHFTCFSFFLLSNSFCYLVCFCSLSLLSIPPSSILGWDPLALINGIPPSFQPLPSSPSSAKRPSLLLPLLPLIHPATDKKVPVDRHFLSVITRNVGSALHFSTTDRLPKK